VLLGAKNNNNNVNIYSAVVMAVPLREFTRFIQWMQIERQAAANPQTKSIDLGCDSVCKLPPCTFIVVTEPEGWQSFYHPTEGRRPSRPRWLTTYRDVHRSQTVTHPSTNRARRKVTTLIETIVLPLSHDCCALLLQFMCFHSVVIVGDAQKSFFYRILFRNFVA